MNVDIECPECRCWTPGKMNTIKRGTVVFECFHCERVYHITITFQEQMQDDEMKRKNKWKSKLNQTW